MEPLQQQVLLQGLALVQVLLQLQEPLLVQGLELAQALVQQLQLVQVHLVLLPQMGSSS